MNFSVYRTINLLQYWQAFTAKHAHFIRFVWENIYIYNIHENIILNNIIFLCLKLLLHGMCESIKNIGKKHGVAVYFKWGRTLKNILVSPKDKDEMVNKNSVIYSYCCGETDCDEEYIGESGRTFGDRFKEQT